MFAPLTGRTVIDLTQVLAGPYCSYQLALLGATVIKVEPPEGGDWARSGGGDAELGAAGMGVGYLTQGGGKKSVAIDLKTEAGKALVLEMTGKADVFLENFRPGTAERLGLGVDAIMGLNSGIVYASLSAYGHDGPMSARPAYDHVIQAVSGIMQLTGDPDTLPNKVGAPYVDYATGQNGALAVLAALMERDRTGEGQRVDVSMLDSSLLLMASHMTGYLTTGNEPKASGNNAFSGSPTSGVFETADGLLALAANNDRQFPRLLKAIDRDDLATDPRFANADGRKKHTDALQAELAETFRSDTANSWETRFATADVPAGRVRGLAEAVDMEQVASRGLMADYTLPKLNRRISVPTIGFKANGDVIRAKTPPPHLGQDTETVLAEFGKTPEDIAQLKATGAIR